MKTRSSIRRHSAIRICAVPLATLFAVSASAADISWNGATDAVWSTGENWVGGVAPTTADVAVFHAGSTTNLNTASGTEFTIAGLKITIPGGLITIGGANTLTLGVGGIGMSAASQSALVALAANQSRNMGAAGLLTVNGVVGGKVANLNKIGHGDMTLAGSNTFTGTTTTGRGTLNMSGSLHGTAGMDLTFTRSGIFNVIEAAGVNQGVGVLRFNGGDSVVRSTHGGSGSGGVNFASRKVRAAGATGNFSLNNETQSAGGTNNSTVGGGELTAQLLDRGVFYNGSRYAAYDAGGFVRGFTTGDTDNIETSTNPTIGDSTATDNADLTTGNITVHTTVFANTINMRNLDIAMPGAAPSLSTNGLLSSSSGEMLIRVNGNSDDQTISTFVPNNAVASSFSNSDTNANVTMVTVTDTGLFSLNGQGDINGAPDLAAVAVNNARFTTGAGTNSHTGPTTVTDGFSKMTASSNRRNGGPTVAVNRSLIYAPSVAAAPPPGVLATPPVDGTWILNGNGNWSIDSNWADGADVDLLGDIADGAGAIANFDTVVFSSNRSITLDTARTIGILQLGNSPSNRSFNLIGGNILTLDNGGSNAQITFKDGGSNANLAVAVALNSNLLITNNDDGGDKGFFFSTGLSSTNGNLTITNNSHITSRTKFNSTVSDGTGTISYSQTVGWTEFNNANTFTGTTSNVAGSMVLGNSLALQNSALDTTASGIGNNVANGNGLKIRGVTALTLGGLTGNKDFASLFNAVVDINNLGYGAMTALTLNPGTGKSHSYSGAIANGAANMTLSKTGAGTQTLSGTNTYTGATTLAAGTLSVAADANLGNANALIFDGGTLQVTGTAMNNFGSHTTSFNAGKTVVLDINDAGNTFTVSQILNQADGGLTKLGAGKLLLTGANTYTGVTTVSSGTLQIGNGGIGASIGPGSGVVLDNNSDLIFNNADNVSCAQGISGAGNLVQAGTGTLTLLGSSTYTGTTTVEAGTLVVNGSLSGSTTVNSGGTLAGENGALGNVTVNSSGRLSPGVDGTGTLNTGTVTFNAGGIYQFQIDSSAPALDSINITGDLNITIGAVMNVSDLGTAILTEGLSAPIITYSGAWNGTGFMGLGDDSIFTLGLNTYQISYNGLTGATNEVTLTVVPEPGVAVSLLGGLSLLLGARRRRA